MTGRREEVSFEPAEPEEPAGSPWWLSRPKLVMLSVGLASGLLIGGLVGVAVVGEDADRPGTEPTVVAGVIEQKPSAGENGPEFAVLLHNGGDESVEVNGLRLLVWRFWRDGSFVADPEGLALLDVEHGVEGRYSLEDGELRIDVDGGYGCGAGDSATWRPSLIDSPFMATDSPQLAVAWLSGSCPDDMKGQIWILSRVLLDAP